MAQTQDLLGRFFGFKAAQLQGLVSATREIVKHALTKGVEAERALADLLVSVLPGRYLAGKGFVIDSMGVQSNEVDLIVLDQLHTARLFDFRAFELVPIEAAVACIEVKTTLDKSELDSTFERFQKIQTMTFHEERVIRTRAQSESAHAVVATTTSRPELVLFAYESIVSDDAIRAAYDRHPELSHAKICVLEKGVVVDLVNPAAGLGWFCPDERDEDRAGRVLAVFLFQFLLPALFDQTKGQRFYVHYLGGESVFSPLRRS